LKITHHLFGGLFFYVYICTLIKKHTYIMKNNAEITQLIFNIVTLEWRLDLHIRGCNQRVIITADEASGIINALTQDDPTRMERAKGDEVIYYIPITK
jgi:hypothetical protein